MEGFELAPEQSDHAVYNCGVNYTSVCISVFCCLAQYLKCRVKLYGDNFIVRSKTQS